MRATEFIRETKVSQPDYPTDYPTSDNPYVLADEPKSGGSALVKIDDDPHWVVKQEKYFSDPASNGNLLYITQIKNRRDNPFLPRAKVVRKEENKQGQSRYTYRIERLFDPRDIKSTFDDTQIEMMGRRDIKDWDTIKKEIENTFGNFNTWTSYTMALAKIIQSNRIDQLKNPKMIEAIDLIKDAMEHSKHGTVRWDLGPSNIMVRLSAQGPQVVISDPL